MVYFNKNVEFFFEKIIFASSAGKVIYKSADPVHFGELEWHKLQVKSIFSDDGRVSNRAKRSRTNPAHS